MLIRRDQRGVLAISQPTHARVCGQLAREWGNELFGQIEPLEEVVLGAEQHDVGMTELDIDPPLNASTGLPQSFTELALEVHLSLWRAGPPRLVPESRYAALLAAMHGRRLYEVRDLGSVRPGEARQIRDFIEYSRGFEASMVAELRRDPVTAPQIAPEVVARNSQLLWNWDLLSLALLLDWSPRTLEAVPTAGGGAVDIVLARAGGAWSLQPWPFAASSVRVRCDGRRLTSTFATQEMLAEGFGQAPWETLEVELEPARGAA